jgi:hypothetical protein
MRKLHTITLSIALVFGTTVDARAGFFDDVFQVVEAVVTVPIEATGHAIHLSSCTVRTVVELKVPEDCRRR